VAYSFNATTVAPPPSEVLQVQHADEGQMRPGGDSDTKNAMRFGQAS